MLRVLIVDDEQPSAEMIRLLLEKNFPQIIISGVASTIAEALEQLKSNDVDLVFLDIVLKGESGFDLLDKIQKRTFQFITLSATKDHAYKTFEYGGSGYLLKPVNRAELAMALSNLLGLRPLVSE